MLLEGHWEVQDRVSKLATEEDVAAAFLAVLDYLNIPLTSIILRSSLAKNK